MNFFSTLVLFLLISFCALGQTKKIVPDQFTTIQGAIDAAINGDTVLVKPGTYFGVIDFKGKEILVTSLYKLTGDTAYISSTIIKRDPAVYEPRAVFFKNGETSKSELSGFTIRDFTLSCCGDAGDGIIGILNASPKLSHLRIMNIIGTGGYAIKIDGANSSEPIILESVEMMRNEIPISSNNASVTLVNCSLTKNSRGISIQGGNLTLINCLSEDNNFTNGGINFTGGTFIMMNSISRTGPGLHSIIPPSLSISADSIIIKNSLTNNSIGISASSFLDTTHLQRGVNNMYYSNGYRPSRYSPTINKGVASVSVGLKIINAPTTDIDGVMRAWSPTNIIDIGPYEYRKDDNTNYQPPTVTLSSSKQLVCDGDEFTVTASPAHYSNYRWNFNKNTLVANGPSITATKAGLYSVDVADEFGATAYDEITVLHAYPYPNQVLCFVSVDTAKQVNHLSWNKTNEAGIKSYVIYKETNVSGQFIAIDTVLLEKAGEYLDKNSKPGESSNRYIIKVINACDELSDYPQNPHKTIHLNAFAGLNGEINLIWEPYEGATVSTYKILRWTSTNKAEVLSEKSASSTSFTDLNPPIGAKYYSIEAQISAYCSPTTLNEQGQVVEGISFSNIISTGIVDGIITKDFDFTLFPVPVKTNFTVTAPETISQIIILDIVGLTRKSVDFDNTSNTVELNKDSLEPGVYLVEITSAKRKAILKILIE